MKRRTGPLASSKSKETGKNYRKCGAKAQKKEYKETWLRREAYFLGKTPIPVGGGKGEVGKRERYVRGRKEK